MAFIQTYLVDQGAIEAFTGMSAEEFKLGGRMMTDPEWTDFLYSTMVSAAQVIHRFCNVPSFEPTLITEFHNGRGATNDEAATSDFFESDYTFYLRQLYLTSGTYTPVVVQEDTSPKTAAPSWVTRTARGTGVAGDYELITDRELTSIAFHANIPLEGHNNVKFTFYTGYDPTSPEYRDIRLQVLKVVQNLLLYKKKVGEISTIRNTGVRDYAQMFEIVDEAEILNQTVRSTLERYRRYPVPTAMYD